MRIRDAVPLDAEAIRTVHYKSIKELGTQAYSQEQVNAWAKGCESANYSGIIEADEVEYIVAETDGGVRAFGSLQLAVPNEYEADVDAEVTGVYVHPSVARQSVGTHIYSELERRARANDVQTLGLSASLNAVSFYEAHGYMRVREHTHEFSSHENSEMTGTIVEMKKEL